MGSGFRNNGSVLFAVLNNLRVWCSWWQVQCCRSIYAVATLRCYVTSIMVQNADFYCEMHMLEIKEVQHYDLVLFGFLLISSFAFSQCLRILQFCWRSY